MALRDHRRRKKVLLVSTLPAYTQKRQKKLLILVQAFRLSPLVPESFMQISREKYKQEVNTQAWRRNNAGSQNRPWSKNNTSNRNSDMGRHCYRQQLHFTSEHHDRNHPSRKQAYHHRQQCKCRGAFMHHRRWHINWGQCLNWCNELCEVQHTRQLHLYHRKNKQIYIERNN